ncbi:hypothetical protein CRM93_03835 [Acetobacter fabarum]|uniref:Uncharacterized protein n=1 Tax=Acetobacter fabarum TaxID=483199 RepID=A0A269XX68_9PROT|nr:hypothetical protein B8X00_09030 [Acetobacter fabarum]PEN28166.1 hypothetical protein CRM93_03835 [Acetobacter fabarum]
MYILELLKISINYATNSQAKKFGNRGRRSVGSTRLFIINAVDFIPFEKSLSSARQVSYTETANIWPSLDPFKSNRIKDDFVTFLPAIIANDFDNAGRSAWVEIVVLWSRAKIWNFRKFFGVILRHIQYWNTLDCVFTRPPREIFGDCSDCPYGTRAKNAKHEPIIKFHGALNSLVEMRCYSIAMEVTKHIPAPVVM